MQLNDAKQLLKKFVDRDLNRDGTIDIREFSELLGIPANSSYTKKTSLICLMEMEMVRLTLENS